MLVRYFQINSEDSPYVYYTHTHTCSHLYAYVCALVHTYKHVCILCTFCVFIEESGKQAGCLRELEWMHKPPLSQGSDTPAWPMTELMLEWHFCRNGDLWQTGLNKSHMVCVSPSVTAHRQFSIHLGWGTLGGVQAGICVCSFMYIHTIPLFQVFNICQKSIKSYSFSGVVSSPTAPKTFTVLGWFY